jgi:uncharacterized protein YneF (UPF0154 family)
MSGILSIVMAVLTLGAGVFVGMWAVKKFGSNGA